MCVLCKYNTLSLNQRKRKSNAILVRNTNMKAFTYGVVQYEGYKDKLAFFSYSLSLL